MSSISVSVDTVIRFWEIPDGKGEVREAKCSFLSGIQLYFSRGSVHEAPQG
jgi:hypothetical protein